MSDESNCNVGIFLIYESNGFIYKKESKHIRMKSDKRLEFLDRSFFFTNM